LVQLRILLPKTPKPLRVNNHLTPKPPLRALTKAEMGLAWFWLSV